MAKEHVAGPQASTKDSVMVQNQQVAKLWIVLILIIILLIPILVKKFALWNANFAYKPLGEHTHLTFYHVSMGSTYSKNSSIGAPKE